MKPRSIIPLVIGLAVGFFAIKMGVDMVKRAKGDEPEQKTVLVSARQIDPAQRIEESMLGTKQVPGNLVPADGFGDKQALVGRVTAMGIPAGVPITKTMLAPPGSEPGLGATIPPGYRAVSVKVTEESAVAGFVMPGSRVDVSATDPKGRGSVQILTDVEVGAVGQSLSQVGPDGKTVRMAKSVTLFLKPEEVQVLHSHTGNGRIKLALRGFGREASNKESLWSRLMAAAAKKRAAPARGKSAARSAQTHVVEVAQGSEVQQIVFAKSPITGRYELVHAAVGHERMYADEDDLDGATYPESDE